jgi:hypothetical protein
MNLSCSQLSALRGVSASAGVLKEPTKSEERLPENEFDHATGMER